MKDISMMKIATYYRITCYVYGEIIRSGVVCEFHLFYIIKRIIVDKLVNILGNKKKGENCEVMCTRWVDKDLVHSKIIPNITVVYQPITPHFLLLLCSPIFSRL